MEIMRCQKCNKEFPEAQIDVSHDVPKYIGGMDKDGRHNICKKCHDIYERLIFGAMCNGLPELTRMQMRGKARIFAEKYFKKEENNGKI